MTGSQATFAALLLAHVLADFVLQSDAMVAGKDRLRTGAAHVAIVFLVTLAAVAGPSVTALAAALAVTVAHGVIDRIKRLYGDDLAAFLIDQAAHLAVLGAVAALLPGLWTDSVWGRFGNDALPVIFAHAGFAILAVRAGRFAVGKLLQTIGTASELRRIAAGSLDKAGARIGELERLVAYALVTTGNPAGVAVLIAAKSILRFDATRDDRAAAEYIIVGTLASIGWALGAGLAARLLTGALP